jgi:hypothetical protein
MHFYAFACKYATKIHCSLECLVVFSSGQPKKLTKNSVAVHIQTRSNAFECVSPAFTPCSLLPQDYMLTLNGEGPVHYKAFKDADGGSKEELEALIEVCQSMHLVMPLNGNAPGSFISSELNPAELICTCKGFKVSSNCSHEVAVTALFISDAQCVPGRTSFDKTYLENLVEKVARVTFRAGHRPRNTVAGTRIQPRDDTVEEEGDGEESDEDLDGM